MKTLFAGSAVLLALARGGNSARVPGGEVAGGTPSLHALLVGCDEYPYLREELGEERYEREVRLVGPRNDVVLVQRTLERVLGLEPEHTRVLSGWGEEATRPTRANILAALETIRAAVEPGAQAIVYLAGHGSQQRVQRDKGLEEPDGLDEVFLPADVRSAKAEQGFVPNSLRDDELGEALRRIRDAGAEVLLLVDACHSGTLLRGAGAQGVRLRGLDPALLGVTPPPASAAPRRAAPQRGWIGTPSSARIAALYGAQSYGRAPEMPTPRDGTEIHGLFTYVLCQELERGGGLGTYQELSERVVAAYQAFPCAITVPSAEGDLARALRGGASGGVSGGPSLLCSLRAGVPWLALGRLAGVEPGLVARVLERSGDERALARVEVLAADLFAARARLLEGELEPGRAYPCEVERRPFGDWRLPLALVDPRGGALALGVLPAEARAFLERARERFPLVAPAAAEWWIVWAAPAPGSDGPGALSLRPAPLEGGLDFFGVRPESLERELDKIQRTCILRRYARSDLCARWTGELELGIERKDARGRGERLGRDAVLHPGDEIRIRLQKNSARIFDVHAFYLDANFRRAQLFPLEGQHPRLAAEARDERYLTRGPDDEWVTIVDDALGLESVLVFATPRAPESRTVDLSFLRQDGVLRGGPEAGPFERMLRRVAEGQDLRGDALGVRGEELEETQALLVTLRTEWGELVPPVWPRTGVVALEALPAASAGKPEKPEAGPPVPRGPRATPEASGPTASASASAPAAAPQSALAPPDPWEPAVRVALMASPEANGKSDVLLLGNGSVRTVLIDFDGAVPRTEDVATLVRARSEPRWPSCSTRTRAGPSIARTAKPASTSCWWIATRTAWPRSVGRARARPGAARLAWPCRGSARAISRTTSVAVPRRARPGSASCSAIRREAQPMTELLGYRATRMGKKLWGLVALWLGACAEQRSFWEAERAASQREAGSVHLSVLAVAPWSHYESVLQPEFHLSADEARREVVRDTASRAERSTQALGLGAAVTEDPDQHGVRTAPNTNVFSGSYMELPRAARPDAMTEFWAATALYQEVQLLNRSVRDAAIPSGYRAYLVRLQISLQPSRRNEPYDAYTTLSFFSPERAATGDGEAPVLVHAPPLTTLRSSPEAHKLPGNGPCVLPLVATDNLEGSLASRSREDVRQFSLALLGFPGNLAADLQAELFQDQMQAQVAARDLNSLMTMARLSENSLRVRLGAMQQASAQYAMVPRNHYVTLLLMVPEEAPPVIDVVARTVLVDTETGAELSGTSEERIRELFVALRARHDQPALDEAELAVLLSCVQKNDQQGYGTALCAALGGEPPATLYHELWLDLVGLMVGSQASSSRFELPGQGQWELPEDFYEQTALLVDTGGPNSSLVLRSATFAEHVELAARLRLSVNGREVNLPAESIERGERELRLRFPSLQELGLSPAAAEGLALGLRFGGDEVSFDVLYVQKSAGVPLAQ